MNFDESKSSLAHITEDGTCAQTVKDILKEQRSCQLSSQKFLDVKNGDIVVECYMILENIQMHFKNI